MIEQAEREVRPSRLRLLSLRRNQEKQVEGGLPIAKAWEAEPVQLVREVLGAQPEAQAQEEERVRRELQVQKEVRKIV